MLEIIQYPHTVLKQKTEIVTEINESIKSLIEEMLETMYANEGIGLAANQVGISKRIAVIDLQIHGINTPILKMINPEIIKRSENKIAFNEGCLSIPSVRAEVSRSFGVAIKYLNENGEHKELCALGLLAVCIQHELDHLDGFVFIDRISALKRSIALKKATKEHEEIT